MNRYAELREKHQKEFDKFPMKFAFSDKQFKEAMESLGLTENDTDKIIGIGAGGFIRKSDLKAYTEMCQRTEKEMQEAIDNDKTGEGFIKEMLGTIPVTDQEAKEMVEEIANNDRKKKAVPFEITKEQIDKIVQQAR